VQHKRVYIYIHIVFPRKKNPFLAEESKSKSILDMTPPRNSREYRKAEYGFLARHTVNRHCLRNERIFLRATADYSYEPQMYARIEPLPGRECDAPTTFHRNGVHFRPRMAVAGQCGAGGKRVGRRMRKEAGRGEGGGGTRSEAASVAKYLSIRYKCLPSSSTSRNKAAKLFSDNALLPFRLLEPPYDPLHCAIPRDIVVAGEAALPKVPPSDNTDKLEAWRAARNSASGTFVILISQRDYEFFFSSLFGANCFIARIPISRNFYFSQI